VFDERADRQGADRRRRPRLFVGQAERHGVKRVLLLKQVVAQRLTFVGNGTGHCGHGQFSFVGVWAYRSRSSAISAPWWMTSRLMCRIRSSIGRSAQGPSAGPIGLLRSAVVTVRTPA